MLKMIAAMLAAVVPFALAAQPVTPAEKPYVPHKTPDMKPKAGAPKKPAVPKPPAPPKKPSNAPPYIYDRHGNAIPTSPDAYDVSSATKKK
jgi:hypothetical protein